MLNRKSGFTLVEMLAATAIIAILAAILLPIVGKVRESGNASKCISNMKQIGAGAAGYAADNSGTLPERLDVHTKPSVESYIYPGKGRPAYGGVFHCPSADSKKKSSLGASLGETYPGLSYGRNMAITYNGGTYKVSSIPQPSKRALAWESSVWNITTEAGNIQGRYAPRHRGGATQSNPLGEAGTFLFIDGHVEMRVMSMNPIDQAEWDELGRWSQAQGNSNITQ
jgi:general secretion pathway protein G